MTNSDISDLLKLVLTMEQQLKEIKMRLQDLHQPAEWLTVKEYAALTGLRSKTVSNYCSKGRIVRTKKINSRYLIHITELPENVNPEDIHASN